MRNQSEPKSTLARCALATMALFAGVVGAPAAWAQSGVWYTVELIVFEQLDSSGLYEERWPLDPGRPSMEGVLELASGRGGEPRPFERLADGELSLRETWSRLRRSRGFRPLLHVGWRQPGYSRSRAQAAHLTSGPSGGKAAPAPDAEATSEMALGHTPEKIDGVIRLYRSRYLHLEADLVYHRPGAAVARADAQSAFAERSPTVFRMTASRRMRSRELHYIDHPLFGVIVLVTPMAKTPVDEPLPEDPVTTPLPPENEPPAEPATGTGSG